MREKKKRVKKIKMDSSQLWLPIRTVRDGIIVTTKNKFIKVMEIFPINFLLKSNLDQTLIVERFESLLRVAPSKFQIKCVSKKAKMEEYLQSIDRETILETNQQCQNMQRQYRTLVSELGETEGISRRFFFAFSFQNDKRTIANTFEGIRDELNAQSQTLKAHFKDCGNETSDLMDTTDGILDMFYELTYRRQAENTPFSQHREEVNRKYAQALPSGEGGQFPPIVDYISPSEVNPSNAGYLIIDGKYYRTLYVTSKGLSSALFAGWLTIFTNLGEGIDVDFFAEKVDNALFNTSRYVRQNKLKVNNTQTSSMEFDEKLSAYQDSEYIKKKLSEGQLLFDINIVITLTADSLEGLNYVTNAFNSIMKSYPIKCGKATFQQEELFLSTLPLSNLDRDIFKKSKRNILTKSLAASFPFSAYEIVDENGVLFGTNTSNNSLAIVDSFDTRKYKNANGIILGVSGAGKTYALQSIATRLRLRGKQIFIIAPLKAHEYKRACDYIGGEFVEIAAGSEDNINIMEIRKKDKTTAEMLDNDRGTTSELSTKIQTIKIFFSLCMTGDENLTIDEKSIIDEAATMAFMKKGITFDNDSLTDTNKSNGAYKKMPILGDLYTELKLIRGGRRLLKVLKPFIEGSFSSFNQKTNVNLDNKYIVFDISKLSKEYVPLGMFIVSDFLWDKAREDRTVEKVIFFDELWELIGSSSSELAADYVLEIFKVIRGYAGSAWAATQDVTDFFSFKDGKYGESILNACKTKLILNLEKKEVEKLGKIINLSTSEGHKVLSFKKGEALLSVNNNNCPITIKTSPIEFQLFTTDQKALAKMKEEMKERERG